MRSTMPIDPHQMVQIMTSNGWTIVGGSTNKSYIRLGRPGAESHLRNFVVVPLDPTAGDFGPLLDAVLMDLADQAALGQQATMVLGELGFQPPQQLRRRNLYVPEHVDAVCDNTSVGVIILDPNDRMLMFRRVKPPVGIAPPCGHVDEHGTAVDAARAETREEVGLTVTRLRPSVRSGGWRDNVCRRHPGFRGFGHDWRIFRATVTGDVHVEPTEAQKPFWADQRERNLLARRTINYARGLIGKREFATDPGLEPVWLDLLHHEGLIEPVSAQDLAAVAALANASPWPQP